MNGKGSKPRPYSVSYDTYTANYDAIFRHSNGPAMCHSTQQPYESDGPFWYTRPAPATQAQAEGPARKPGKGDKHQRKPAKFGKRRLLAQAKTVLRHKAK